MKRENKQIKDWNELVGNYRKYQISPTEKDRRETLRKLEQGMKDYLIDYQTPFNPCTPPEI